MIASLHGKLESIGSNWVIVNVNGVGFQVYMSTATLSTLGASGNQVHLLTHLMMREDSVTLYGFSANEELELFQILISVSGLGPRLALAVLSSMSVEQASTAIATGSTDLLITIPGIGKRMAERLVVELKNKIGAGLLTSPTGQLVQENIDVLAALTSLGYSTAESGRAVATLPSTSDLSLEERIRLALQYFATE
jgi:Holliday junction DNA helicase RuvA